MHEGGLVLVSRSVSTNQARNQLEWDEDFSDKGTNLLIKLGPIVLNLLQHIFTRGENFSGFCCNLSGGVALIV